MILSSKSLIFFLNIFFTLVFTCEVVFALPKTSEISERLPYKKARLPKVGAMTAASMPVRFTWQTIRSLGHGTKMNTSAETFSVDGRIVPTSVSMWSLNLSGLEAPVTIVPGSKGGDGVLFIERDDLLRLLAIDVNSGDSMSDNDPSAVAARTGHVKLAISKSPGRFLETIYRSPDEELFIVKAAVSFIGQQ